MQLIDQKMACGGPHYDFSPHVISGNIFSFLAINMFKKAAQVCLLIPIDGNFSQNFTWMTSHPYLPVFII